MAALWLAQIWDSPSRLHPYHQAFFYNKITAANYLHELAVDPRLTCATIDEVDNSANALIPNTTIWFQYDNARKGYFETSPAPEKEEAQE